MIVSLLLSLLICQNGPVEINLWVDREQAVYHPYENLKIFFQVDHDCYIAVYDIDVEGEKMLLFPLNGNDGWIEAGKIYELPPPYSDYDYMISGPEGIETIVAIASPERPPHLQDEGYDISKEMLEIYIKEPEPAKLRIISDPEYCRIYIRDEITDETEYVGRAPRTVVIRPGVYTVKIKKSGYRTLVRRINLDPGERRRAFVKLIPY